MPSSTPPRDTQTTLYSALATSIHYLRSWWKDTNKICKQMLDHTKFQNSLSTELVWKKKKKLTKQADYYPPPKENYNVKNHMVTWESPPEEAQRHWQPLCRIGKHANRSTWCHSRPFYRDWVYLCNWMLAWCQGTVVQFHKMLLSAAQVSDCCATGSFLQHDTKVYRLQRYTGIECLPDALDCATQVKKCSCAL